MNLDPGSKIGDYEILAQLGAGGMGRVYKVRNELSDRIEAMKVLLPDLEGQADLANRFLREIKVQANLDHPNIAKLYTASRIENRLLMFMEYCEGNTLDERLKQGAIPLADAINYIQQVLAALDYAHQRGVVHRDIKPANMMLMPDSRIKLLDFGIAKAAADNRLTMTGTTLGSLYYMSPEQIQGSSVDMRSDLYSVGVSLYEMVTGAKPFDGESQFAIMSAHLARNPVPPIEVNASLPPAVSEIILMSLSKDPVGRFQTASAFLNALRNVPLADIASAPLPAVPDATRFDARQTAPLSAPPPPPPLSAAAPPLRDSVANVTAVPAAPLTPAAPPPAPAADFHLIEPTGAGRRSGPKRALWVVLGGLAAALAIVAYIQFGPRIKTSAKESAPPIQPPAQVATTTLPQSLNTPPAQPPSAPPVEPPSSQPPSNQPPSSQPPVAVGTSPKLPPLPGKPPATGDTRKSRPERAQAQPQPVVQQPPVAQQPPQQAQPQPQPTDPAPPSNRMQPTTADVALTEVANRNRMQIEELADQYEKMVARANALKATMDNIRASQASQGVGMRSDWIEMYNLLVTHMQNAKRALAHEDPPAARTALTRAERQLSTLENAMGR